ncbi:EAL domain-containing protein [Micromonospora sp. NPDC049559]|uniref:putative bifunctional diguanylate cyclase/phosphodiesterase n=1 Tax=Micromonospora sp. NPDC049559 TaxID=3155923 RepID=UPI003438BE4B
MAGYLAVTAAGPRPPLYLVLTLVFAVLVANRVMVRVRIGANQQGISWTEVAFLVGLAVAPPSWVVLTTAAGIAISKFVARVGPMKGAFGVAKETLGAATAGLIFVALGHHATGDRPTADVGTVALALIAVTALDEGFTTAAIAFATRRPIRQLLRLNWDIRLGSLLARFVVTLLTIGILTLNGDARLLLVIPPLALSLHLWSSSRLRSRSERDAWQRLASATDALNNVDLDAVLTTAVTSAARLFSADEIEIELVGPDGPRLIRGTAQGIGYDGPAGTATASANPVIESRLEGRDGEEDLGTLRLRFRGAVVLSERESYTLRTFTSALCTAIRNASAYAELARVADDHAHAATHDALTGLANRRYLLEQGNEQLNRRRAEGVTALLLVDLNHFKEVNDTLGHAAGDRVLVQVAERLRAASQDGDLVARLGGDEFAILLRGVPAPAVAAHRAEALLAALHQPIDLDGMRINVEASGGIAIAPSTGGGMAELLRRADVAMYQAKRTNRRVATYVPTRDTADLGRLALGGDLPRAVADHEFTVNFQPIVDLGTGEVIAAEALTRWQHPVHGMMDPLRFLETVERSGLLPAFAEAVLDQSLVAAKSWREAGFELPVAVNVSPRSLLDPRFPGSVLARLRAHQLPSDLLILELTETLTISQLEVVDQVLGQLRDAGVRLALDDFGTGYSSLSVLSRIPVHELKIDRAFVMSMETSPEAAAVIRSTVDLGRSLDLMVVAEGVESEPQRAALWELGCAAGQGHLFGRAMPAQRLLAALRRGSGGRPGTLAPALHDEGSVIRIAPGRRPSGRVRPDRLPHLPA